MSARDYRKGVLAYEFVAIPKKVLASQEWFDLPSGSRSLMIDLMRQYTGKNNGRLCPAFDVMNRYGWSSKDTLTRAKRSLLACSFVVMTRKGHPPRTAEWIGLTWWRLNHDPSMDIAAKDFPHLNFLTIRAASIDPNVGRERSKRTAVSVVRIPGRYPPKVAPGPPDSGPIRCVK